MYGEHYSGGGFVTLDLYGSNTHSHHNPYIHSPSSTPNFLPPSASHSMYFALQALDFEKITQLIHLYNTTTFQDPRAYPATHFSLLDTIIQKIPSSQSSSSTPILELINLLLEYGAAPNCEHHAPLVSAARIGSVHVVKMLLDYGADLWNGDNLHALIAALQGGHAQVVQLLLHRGVHCPGAIPAKGDGNGGRTKRQSSGCLINAIRCGNVELVKMLIEYGCVNVDDYDEAGDTPLHAAVRSNNVGMVEILLGMGATSDIVGCYGKTPLMLAVDKGYEGIVEVLLDYGADVKQRDSKKRSVLDIGLERGRAKINVILQCSRTSVKFPMERGTAENPVRIMQEAMRMRDWPNVAKILTMYGKSVANVGIEGAKSVLHAASEAGSLGVVASALAYGAVPDARDRYGKTPAYVAALNDHHEVVDKLIEAGTGDQWVRLLHIATSHNNKKVVKFACGRRKEIIGAKDRYGRTALWFAAWNGPTDMARYLLERHRADPNVQALCGSTPLLVATQRGDQDTVELLLRHRAVVDVREPLTGRTPFMAAIEHRNFRLVELLFRHTADPVGEIQEARTLLNPVANHEVMQFLHYLQTNAGANPDRGVTLERDFGYDVRATFLGYLKGDIELRVDTIIGAVKHNKFDTVDKLLFAHNLAMAGVRAKLFTDYRKGKVKVSDDPFFFYRNLYHPAYQNLRSSNLSSYEKRIADDILVSARDHGLIDNAESIIGDVMVAGELDGKIKEMGSKFSEVYEDICKAHDHVQRRLGRLDEVVGGMRRALQDLSNVVLKSKWEIAKVKQNQVRMRRNFDTRITTIEYSQRKQELQSEMNRKTRTIAAFVKVLLAVIPFFGTFLGEAASTLIEKAVVAVFEEALKMKGERQIAKLREWEQCKAQIKACGYDDDVDYIGSTDFTDFRMLRLVLSNDFGAWLSESNQTQYCQAKALLDHTVEENFGPLKTLQLELDKVINDNDGPVDENVDSGSTFFDRMAGLSMSDGIISSNGHESGPSPLSVSPTSPGYHEGSTQSVSTAMENTQGTASASTSGSESGDPVERRLLKRFEYLKDTQVSTMMIRYCFEGFDDDESDDKMRAEKERIRKGVRDWEACGRSLIRSEKSPIEVARGILDISSPKEERGVFSMVVDFIKGFREQKQEIVDLLP